MATSPAERAKSEADRLDAAGLPVTTRAIREGAGVAMAVALAAAREHTNAQANKVHVPDMPPEVASRFQLAMAELWRSAYVTAQTQFDDDRAAAQAVVEQANNQRDVLAEEYSQLHAQHIRLGEDLADAQAHVASLATEIKDLQEQVTAANRQTSEARSAQATAEGTLAGLREAVSALRGPGTSPQAAPLSVKEAEVKNWEDVSLLDVPSNTDAE